MTVVIWAGAAVSEGWGGDQAEKAWERGSPPVRDNSGKKCGCGGCRQHRLKGYVGQKRIFDFASKCRRNLNI